MIAVALVDEGLSKTFCAAKDRWVIGARGDAYPDGKDYPIDNHAGACCQIIRRMLGGARGKAVRWLSIKVLGAAGQGSIDQLLGALKLCEQLEVKLVHLSLGTANFQFQREIETLCDRLIQRGTYIIAAGNNEGTATLPACLRQVIGVQAKQDLKAYQFLANDTALLSGIDFLANGSHLIRCDEKFHLTKGNSYAAPVLTGRVILYLMKYPFLRLEELMDRLRLSSLTPKVYLPACTGLWSGAGAHLILQVGEKNGFLSARADGVEYRDVPLIALRALLQNDDLKNVKLIFDCTEQALPYAVKQILQRNGKETVLLERDKVVCLTDGGVDWEEIPLKLPGGWKAKRQAPLISLEGFNKDKLVVLLHELAACFAAAGYVCKTTLRGCGAILYDAEPVNAGCERYFDYLSEYYQCDLLLYGDLGHELAAEPDLRVLNRGEQMEKTLGEAIFYDGDVQNLFDQILERLR
ncbi:Subtilisin DY [uncultured Clostridium sp.]|nr:Subtilisin DY [uncultured Clostridium sp.]